MPNIDDEIRSKTEAFAADLAVLVRRVALQSVSAALGVSHVATHVGAPRRAAAPVAVAAGVKRGRGRPRKVVAAAPVVHVVHPAQPAKPARPAKGRAKAAPAAKASVSKKPAAAKRPLGAKRPPAELSKLTDRLGEYIKANPGRRMEAIAKALGAPTKELNLPVKKLLAAKKIRSEGQKRATEYFPA